MKTIFIAIAFGTSVRDVLRNDVFQKLKQQSNLKIVIIALEANNIKFREEFAGNNVFFEPLLRYRPSLIERILLLFHKAILREKCRSIDLGNTSGETFTLNLMTPIAKLVKFFLGGDKGVLRFLDGAYKNLTKKDLYKETFAKYRPDLVIVTRVLSYSMDYPVLKRAAEENVPIVSLISSWDNLTSKGFFPFSISSLVVWNAVIKEEAIDLFLFPKEKIYISGIPRYDLFFQRKGFGSKEDFFKRFGLDLNKKLITYGTGSSTTGKTKLDPISPQSEIVEFIAENLNILSEDAQLLVRLHPQANPEEYSRLREYENVILHIPGKKSSFHDRLFHLRDDIELGESMLYSDVVVNYGSTITIDAAVFDTPVVCVNFDFRGKRPYKYSMTRLYEFDHFKKLIDIGGVKLPKSREQLLEAIDNYIKDPSIDKIGRAKIINQQCHFKDGKSGERVANHIIKLLQEIDTKERPQIKD